MHPKTHPIVGFAHNNPNKVPLVSETKNPKPYTLNPKNPCKTSFEAGFVVLLWVSVSKVPFEYW